MQNCDKKQYLFPQLGGGITQPHVIQNTIILIQSSHNHKQWTRQVSGSMMASLLRPFYRVTDRCTDVAPVLGRETDLEEVIVIRHHSRTLVLHLCKKGEYCKVQHLCLMSCIFLCRRFKMVNTDVQTYTTNIFNKFFLNI